MKRLFSLACFLIFTILIVEAVPYMWEVFNLVKENPGGKLNGNQQFGGAIAVGFTGGMVLGGIMLSAMGMVIPWLPKGEHGTGSTGAR
jgi:hypothetical protein